MGGHLADIGGLSGQLADCWQTFETFEGQLADCWQTVGTFGGQLADSIILTLDEKFMVKDSSRVKVTEEECRIHWPTL